MKVISLLLSGKRSEVLMLIELYGNEVKNSSYKVCFCTIVKPLFLLLFKFFFVFFGQKWDFIFINLPYSESQSFPRFD